MASDLSRPSARHLSGSPDGAELRRALQRDGLARGTTDCFIVGVDGPMEDRPVGDGATILWSEQGQWFIDHSERGRVSSAYALIFETEASACRWLYDVSYLLAYGQSARSFLRYLEDIGDGAAATQARSHREAIDQALTRLHGHRRSSWDDYLRSVSPSEAARREQAARDAPYP